MDLNELIESTLRSQHLEEMQNRPREEYSPIKGMSSEQIERYACFLYKELQARVEQLERMNVRLDEIMDELKKSGKKIDNLTGLLEKANDRADKALLESKMHQKENIELKKMNATLQQRLNLMNSMAFGPSKSQKGIEKKKPVRGRHDDKDDFDGTSQSLAPAEEPAEQPREEKAPKESRERPGRKGMVYNKSVVGTPIIHKSDYSRLPPGAVVISSKFKVVRDVISRIEEHHFEVLKVKYADGHIRSVYLPIPGEAGAELYDEVVPGTHITASLLSYLLFNRFQMATPANREARNRLADMDWVTSPQNLLNWADKGAIQLNRLIPALKKVYTYLDNELIDIEHLCCLAHARAKFKYAYEQGCKSAYFFLYMIGRLYRLEEEYRRLKLSPQEIYERRNDDTTTEIVESIRTRLYELLADGNEVNSDLMLRALNYLRTFWKQIFAYRNDGEYSIDNTIAERAIRPIVLQRNGSMFFGSVKGISNSAVFNTFIETCKQLGISFRDYFCRLMREMKKGRTDYENLLPMTIYQ
jgi:exonuclease VII small subunit